MLPFARRRQATRLEFAASEGLVAEVAQLLRDGDGAAEGPQSREMRSDALLSAVSNGHVEVVELLVASGVDLEHRSEEMRSTALMIAALQGSVAIVRLLLDHGADLRATRFPNQTALTIAADKGNVEVLELLLDRSGLHYLEGSEEDRRSLELLLRRAAYYGRVEVVRLLADRGVALDHRDPKGLTALTWAAMGVNAGETAALLLERCPGVLECMSDNGETPLIVAARDYKDAVVRELLRRGAFVDHQNNDGDTALHKVCQYYWKNREDVVEILLGANADIEIRNLRGETPLCIARQRHPGSATEALLRRAAHFRGLLPFLRYSWTRARSRPYGVVADLRLDLAAGRGFDPDVLLLFDTLRLLPQPVVEHILALCFGGIVRLGDRMATPRTSAVTQREEGETDLCRAAGAKGGGWPELERSLGDRRGLPLS